jgi:predicted nucleotidyltransferase component of viral defense system
MLGTKMRALFQRKKGRDLFDLYWALTTQSALPVSADDIVSAFQHYMREEDTHVPRAEFVAHLRSCLDDKTGFCTDMVPLLREGCDYDARKAGLYVQNQLLTLLPE